MRCTRRCSEPVISTIFLAGIARQSSSRHGRDDGGGEVDKDDEAHREAAHAAHAIDPEQLDQVVNGRIDPSAALRDENAPVVRRERLCFRFFAQLELEVRKGLPRSPLATHPVCGSRS